MNAVDLFSGVGGMSLGFKREGFKVKLAMDFDRRHVESYNLNYKEDICKCVDLSNIDFDIYKNSSCGNIDVVFGGPPCQGFSIGGKQKVNDERNELIHSFFDSVKYLRPNAFVMENVAGLLQKNYRDFLIKTIEKFRKIGYTVGDVPYLLNAKDVGVPQNRKRIFLIGFKDIKIDRINQCEKVLLSKNETSFSVKDAIFDLSRYNDLYSPEVDSHKLKLEYDTPYLESINYLVKDRKIIRSFKKKKEEGLIGGLMVTKHSEKVIKRFCNTLSGTREPISRYYKLDWLGLSPTLRAGTTIARGQFMAPRPIHPKYPRCITVREAARLHSYPDYFEFYPTKWYGQMQIGNSVPPLLAQRVAKFVREVLN